MDERRQYQRTTDVEVQVHQCVTSHMGQEVWLEATAFDMSATGLCLVMDKSRNPGEELFILATVTKPGEPSRELSVNGVSTYCRPGDDGRWRVGVRFTDLGEWEQEDWAQFLGI